MSPVIALLMAQHPMGAIDIHTNARTANPLSVLEHQRPARVYLDGTVNINGRHPIVWVYELPGAWMKWSEALRSHKDFPPNTILQPSIGVSKTSPGVTTSYVSFAGIERPNPKRPSILEFMEPNKWTTLKIEDRPGLLTQPRSWPREASGFEIQDPKPPVAVVHGKKPVQARQWMAQAAGGTEYRYAFDCSVAELRHRVDAWRPQGWLPMRGPDGNGYSLWTAIAKAEPHRPTRWLRWTVTAVASGESSTKSLLVVDKADVMKP